MFVNCLNYWAGMHLVSFDNTAYVLVLIVCCDLLFVFFGQSLTLPQLSIGIHRTKKVHDCCKCTLLPHHHNHFIALFLGPPG